MMPQGIQLSVNDARRLALVGQGLHPAKAFGTGKNAVLRCLEQLGYVQIDTIFLISRSHHHCFHTRVPSYSAQQLDALQRDKKILEYWAHAAAYLPMALSNCCDSCFGVTAHIQAAYGILNNFVLLTYGHQKQTKK